MAEEAARLLCADRSGGLVVDGTLGLGGHAERILRAGDGFSLLGIDRDPAAIALARERLAPFGERARLVEANFRDLARLLEGRRPDGVLLDLGMSSFQLGEAARGFSYLSDGPLDMTMGPDARPARELLASGDEREIARVLRDYGEERRARSMARAIARRSAEGRMRTTFDLRDAVAAAAPGRDLPGTLSRVFQAVRIWANGELDHLDASLPAALEALAPGGRLVVISYHSLEDRIVKRFFRREERGCVCPPDFPECRCGREPRLRPLFRSALRPSPEELAANVRSRSARLRAGERV